MSENKLPTTKKAFSADWLVRGVLTKIGETFDKLTGRNWKPSSSLATSELIERLKKMLDAKVKDEGIEKGRFVPHQIKLKMQWDKFSTDAEAALKKLEHELLAAAIDHINDNRYHTYAPLKVEVKPDYFTEGVNLYAGFGSFGEDEQDQAVNVTVPQMSLQNIVIGAPETLPEPEPETEKFIVYFRLGEREKQIELEFAPGKRRNVGRTKENDLVIDDASVSKIHASLVLNNENRLMVADTGSTNGTFINGQRIAYGKAFAIGNADKIKFGTIEVFIRRVPKPVDFATRESFENESFKTEQLPSATVPANQEKMPSQLPTESFKTDNNYDINNGAQNIQKESQVFQTEQRIKLDFDEKENN